jgi:hypothetical protein
MGKTICSIFEIVKKFEEKGRYFSRNFKKKLELVILCRKEPFLVRKITLIIKEE